MAFDPRYHDRARAQIVAWAMGKSYHEPTNDECSPDFSCCYSELFTQSAEDRWEQYRQYLEARSLSPTKD